MSYDAHKNLAYSTVATAPSPASSGTSLVVATGDGSKFPAVPFNATIWPIGALPTPANAEIVRVTTVSTDTLTITRAQESTSARSVIVGDQIAATITAKLLTDIEANTRERLTADRTYYVRTDGNDSNTGLANTSGGAFLTIQKALDVVAQNIDLAGHNITISVADGTYTGANAVSVPWVGKGTVTVTGNNTTPANCVLSITAAPCFSVSGGAALYVSGFKFVTTSGASLVAYDAGLLILTNNVEFGSCTIAMQAYRCGIIRVYGAANYTISASSTYHIYVSFEGVVSFGTGQTTTLTGTPAFGEFAHAESLGVIAHSSNTFSGSATGTRYGVYTNSVINTNGGGANYFPGNAVGGTSTGGQYA